MMEPRIPLGALQLIQLIADARQGKLLAGAGVHIAKPDPTDSRAEENNIQGWVSDFLFWRGPTTLNVFKFLWQMLVQKRISLKVFGFPSQQRVLPI